MYGKKRLLVRCRFCWNDGLIGKLEDREELGKAGDAARGEWEWKASEVIEGPGTISDWDEAYAGMVSMSSESMSIVGMPL